MITHMRGAVGPGEEQIANTVIQTYLPRIVNLFLRLSELNENALDRPFTKQDLDDEAQGVLSFERLMPSHEQHGTLKVWLQLPS